MPEIMKFEITIDDNEWCLLDFFLEQVEKGTRPEADLFKNDTFLNILTAVKYDVNNYTLIPYFIRGSALISKYCLQVNPDVKTIMERYNRRNKDCSSTHGLHAKLLRIRMPDNN